MPHAVEQHVEQQYEMLMPILARPRPYWRYPNATEAYRSMHRSPSTGKGTGPLAVHPGSGTSFLSHAGVDPVVTDDSGLHLLQSTVQDEDGRVAHVLQASELDVRVHFYSARFCTFEFWLCCTPQLAHVSKPRTTIVMPNRWLCPLCYMPRWQLCMLAMILVCSRAHA
jgi:hypothetical protein